jgi:hypothetical protein
MQEIDVRSLERVLRVTSPARMTTSEPAARPPSVIAPSDRPDTRKPIAAPGKIACAIASPKRLMRRSIMKTPTGPAPSDSAIDPTSARRMKSNSANGAISAS